MPHEIFTLNNDHDTNDNVHMYRKKISLLWFIFGKAEKWKVMPNSEISKALCLNENFLQLIGYACQALVSFQTQETTWIAYCEI